MMDAGFAVAAGFIGVGLLWLITVQFIVGIVEWIRTLLG